jgi:predicted RNA-binding protein with PUA-like domain
MIEPIIFLCDEKSMGSSYWLMKTEPETYSFQQLIQDKKTHWNGVRNFQARNYLKQIAQDDLVLIYHSGDDREVVGIARVVRAAYPDPDPKKAGDWVQVDIAAVESLKTPVTLVEIKKNPALKEMPLIKQSRLSVMPITEKHYKTIMNLGAST